MHTKSLTTDTQKEYADEEAMLCSHTKKWLKVKINFNPLNKQKNGMLTNFYVFAYVLNLKDI